jgi:hypothetical protein
MAYTPITALTHYNNQLAANVTINGVTKTLSQHVAAGQVVLNEPHPVTGDLTYKIAA